MIISDYNRTYAVFIYKCWMELPTGSFALIGINVPTEVNQFRYSNMNRTSYIGCLNQPRDFYTLMYSLTEHGSVAAGMDLQNINGLRAWITTTAVDQITNNINHNYRFL